MPETDPLADTSPEKYPFFHLGLLAPIEYKLLVFGKISESKVIAAARLTVEIKFFEKAILGSLEL